MIESACSTASSLACAPAHCHWRCALGVIDELLAAPGAASGEEVDHLLDLRWHLRERRDAEGSLRLFCDLRRRMEARHYLAFFRLRRWLENHLVARAETSAQNETALTPVKLDFYCVEAVRRACLCSALKAFPKTAHPRIRFNFRVLSPSEPAAGAGANASLISAA